MQVPGGRSRAWVNGAELDVQSMRGYYGNSIAEYSQYLRGYGWGQLHALR